MTSKDPSIQKRSGVSKLLVNIVEAFGSFVLTNIDGLGRISRFGGQFFYWWLKPPYRFKLLFEQMFVIGYQSLFIICLAATFTGMVMAFQMYFGFQLISVDSLVGPVVTLTLAKELAPVMSGLIVAGKAGSSMAAQIGTMKVTEQVDALEVMGINSYQYLAVPRIIAATISLPMLSAIFLAVGNLGSYFVGTKALMIDEATYLSKLGDFMFMADIYHGLIKAFFFGFIIAVIGTYFGFQVSKGAEGVGRGTNQAVVWGMITVLILDYILTSFLLRIL